jgi:hypothetical protein
VATVPLEVMNPPSSTPPVGNQPAATLEFPVAQLALLKVKSSVKGTIKAEAGKTDAKRANKAAKERRVIMVGQYKIHDCGQPPNEGASLSTAVDTAIVSQSQ